MAITTTDALRENFQKALDLVKNSHGLLLLSHEYTDGDDLGSILALGMVFEKLGKKVFIAARGGVPENLLFLPGHSEVRDTLPEDLSSFDLLVTLGCGTLARPGFPALEKWTKPILNIDHHHDTKLFGTVNVWDESRAANCELVYVMLREWGMEIDKSTALNLLTGIFTDTGGFRHANVSSQTLEIAAELLRNGAKLDLIARFTLSRKDLPKLRVWAQALENARFDEERKIVQLLEFEHHDNAY